VRQHRVRWGGANVKKKMNRRALTRAGFALPIHGTNLDTIADPDGRYIGGRRCRDCTAATLRPDQRLHQRGATFLKHNREGEHRERKLETSLEGSIPGSDPWSNSNSYKNRKVQGLKFNFQI
jgi:hypothetical protein